MSDANVLELNDSNFENVLSSTTGPLLLDFWADGCAPCRMLAPMSAEIAGENVGRFKIAKLNLNDAPQAFAKFGVRNVPSLLFFKDGEKRDQAVGMLGKAEIVRRLGAIA